MATRVLSRGDSSCAAIVRTARVLLGAVSPCAVTARIAQRCQCNGGPCVGMVGFKDNGRPCHW